MYKQRSNEELMEKYAKGDTEAFNALYARNKAALFRYFLRQTQYSNQAEELSQDVWTKVIRASKDYKPKAKFTTYLYQIAHNHLIDHIRKQLVRVVESNDTSSAEIDPPARSSEQPENELESEQDQALILSLVHQLPEAQREVFILKEEAGLDLRDIASITASGEETVKSRLRYALAKLREGLVETYERA